MKVKTSGNQTGWVTAIAARIMDAGDKPASFASLIQYVPRDVGATATNDGHCTAGEVLGETFRDDFRAGQKIIVEEMLGFLREQGFVGGDDTALTWLKPLDGEWLVQVGDMSIAIAGQLERRKGRDRSFLGERIEDDPDLAHRKGLIETGKGTAFTVDVKGPRGGIERRTLEIHPLAFLTPPMTEREREGLRADILKNGVRQPLILYPDKPPDPRLSRSTKPVDKVLDGRHRLYLASVLGVPVEVTVFEGTEEEAKGLVISLNFHRRHLTTPQRALAIVRLYGEKAKKEANGAMRKGRPKKGKGGSEPSRKTDEVPPVILGSKWPQRALAMAGPIGVGITPDAVRNIEPVLRAPETLARVERGEITRVGGDKGAHQAAKKELGEPPAPRGLNGSESPRAIWGLLGLAKNNLELVLEDFDGRMLGDGDILARLTALEGLIKRIRTAFNLRKQL